jgi:hypothetical protein
VASNSKEQKIDEILGKALRDREFRAKLTSDPKAAAEDCGLTVEEMDLIAGGLAIGDSLLNPQTVSWCTGKTCNETGKRVRTRPERVIRPGDKVLRPGAPAVKPGTRQSLDPVEDGGADTRLKEEVE